MQTFPLRQGFGGQVGDTTMTQHTRAITDPESFPLFTGMDKRAMAVAVSPDESILAVGYQNGVIVLWDLQTQKIYKKLKRPMSSHNDRGAITNLHFLSCGQLFATDRLTDCWFIEIETNTWESLEGTRMCESFSLSPDKDRAVCVSQSGTIYNIHFASRKAKQINHNRNPRKCMASCATFLEDNQIATGDRNGRVTIHHVGKRGGPSDIPPQRYGVQNADTKAILAIPDEWLITGDTDGNVKCWNGPLHVGGKIAEPVHLFEKLGNVTCLSLCKDGRTLLVAHVNMLTFFDLVNGNQLKQIRGFLEPVTSVCLFCEDRFLAVDSRRFDSKEEAFCELSTASIFDFGAKNLGRAAHPLEERFAAI